MGTSANDREQAAWKEWSEELKADRRREKRINLAFPIELFGFDSAIHYFTERTVTINVSKSGCQLRLKNRVEERTVVAIRVTPPEGTQAVPKRPTLFLITWVERAGDKWAVGACTLQPGNIWPVALPDEPKLKQGRPDAA